MTINAGNLAAERAQLEALRRGVGARLATYRTAAGISQPELGQALGKTRSLVSKVEHGTRGMPAELWVIADTVCCADGALLAEHSTLAAAEQDYRGRCRIQRRAVQRAAAQAHAQALTASLVPASSPDVLLRNRGDEWPEGGGLVSAGLAEELMVVVTGLARTLGRRDAMRLVSGVLAAVGLSGLDPDEYTRLAQAVASPNRVDAHVVQNLAATLAHCKRLEDGLGPRAVLDTVVAQHGLVRNLLEGGCPDQLRRPLSLVDSNMASTIGGYLVDMCQPEAASRYFAHARRAGHDAGSPACAAYAAANASFAAFLRGDTPAALDTAAAARSLATRTHDLRLKALAEQMAAAAYALDGQYGPCMAASARAHDLLTTANGSVSESPAYWVHHGTIDSQRSIFLCLLGKPSHAVDAASTARAQFDRTFVGGYVHCQVRLGHALVLDKDITEAARVLGDAASHARLSPRHTQELRTVRTLMQPWAGTQAVTTLDAQLRAYGLLPATTPRPGTHIPTTT